MPAFALGVKWDVIFFYFIRTLFGTLWSLFLMPAFVLWRDTGMCGL